MYLLYNRMMPIGSIDTAALHRILLRTIVLFALAIQPLVAIPASGQVPFVDLTPASIESTDQYGWAVAADSSFLFVGARTDDTWGTYAGAVYVFRRVGEQWVQSQKLSVSDGGNFGSSIAVRDELLVVGAPGDGAVASNAGAAYVFERVGDTWTNASRMIATDGSTNDNFGRHVAVVGTDVVVTAPGNATRTGAAYVFRKTAGQWQFTQKLVPSDAPQLQDFGRSMASDNSRLAICGRKAYVFEVVAGSWVETAIIPGTDSQFGHAVAIRDSTIAVGSPFESLPVYRTGAVHVYEQGATDWALVQTIRRDDPGNSDQLGNVVEFVGDRLIAGSVRYHGQLHAYEYGTGTWRFLGLLDQSFGIAAAGTADFVVAGNFEQNEARVFHLDALAGIPLPVAPADKATGVDLKPVLSWNEVLAANTYALQLATDANFNELVVDAPATSQTSYQFSGFLSGDTPYFWRVASTNWYHTSQWSDVWSFTTVVQRPPVANDDYREVLEDSVATIDALENDIDLDGDVLSITRVSSAQFGTVEVVSESEASYTPSPDFFGSDTFEYVVDDGRGGRDSAVVTIEVMAVNDSPIVISIPDTVVNERQQYLYDFESSDVDDSAIFVDVVSHPEWISVTDHGDGTASLSGVPLDADVGMHFVAIQVTDGLELVEQTFDILVLDVEHAPTFTSEPLNTVAQGEAYEHVVTAEDLDGDTLSFSAPTLPSWIVISSSTSSSITLTGNPTNDDVGFHPVHIEVTDRRATVEYDYVIRVTDVNDPPSPAILLSPPDSSALILSGEPEELVEIFWTPAADIDGDSLDYEWQLSFAEIFETIEYSIVTQDTVVFVPLGDFGATVTAAGVLPDSSIVAYHRVVARDSEYESNSPVNRLILTRGAITAIESIHPTSYELLPNYPNPFRTSTSVTFTLPEPSHVVLRVFDLLGQLKTTFVDGELPAGEYTRIVEATGLASGLYLLRLESATFSATRRMTIVR